MWSSGVIIFMKLPCNRCLEETETKAAEMTGNRQRCCSETLDQVGVLCRVKIFFFCNSFAHRHKEEKKHQWAAWRHCCDYDLQEWTLVSCWRSCKAHKGRLVRTHLSRRCENCFGCSGCCHYCCFCCISCCSVHGFFCVAAASCHSGDWRYGLQKNLS